MKRTLLLLSAVCMVTVAIAQKNAIDTYFKAHLTNPAFSKFHLTERTFDLITEIETDNPEEQNVLEAIGKLDGILVLTNENTQISSEYYQEAMDKLVPDEAYEDLMVVEHKKANVRFLIRENETAIQEFVMVVGEENNFVLASIYGDIDVANISKLAHVIKSNGKNWFALFENVDSEELVFGDHPIKSSTKMKNAVSKTQLNNVNLNIYPNPATEFINISAEDGTSIEMKAAFYSLLGKEIQTVGTVTLPYTINLEDLPSGAYFLRLTDKDGVFKNFKIVKPETK